MLVASAAKAGLRCRAIDLFADLDTQQLSEQSQTVSLGSGEQSYSFRTEALLRAVTVLDPAKRCSIIYGSGFEGDPDVLTTLSYQREVLGNSAATIELLKQPAQLVNLLQILGIPHPEICFELPDDDHADWLQKQIGACGGHHVQRLDGGCEVLNKRIYFQRFVAGRNLSATFLSDGNTNYFIGFCEQHHADLTDYPFNYGGAVSVNADDLPDSLLTELKEAAQQLVQHAGIIGLWGMDFIVNGDACWWLLEINPRPCATLELHEDCLPVESSSLLPWHISAVKGYLANLSQAGFGHFTRHHGNTVVYAKTELIIPPGYRWPAWSSDRPHPGSCIQPGQPVCTVHAHADSIAEVYKALRLRQNIILSELASTTSASSL